MMMMMTMMMMTTAMIREMREKEREIRHFAAIRFLYCGDKERRGEGRGSYKFYEQRDAGAE